MLKKVGCKDAIITDDIAEIKSADKLILPGVGSWDMGMKNLKASGLLEPLNNQVLIEKKPILGICLGAQLMCTNSEEGKEKGLEWFNCDVIKFKINDASYKVPHMGWNEVMPMKESQILKNLPKPSRFYFVHSYFMKPNDSKDILLETEYSHPFCSALQKDNITAFQFHPEKSHKFGMQVFKNFIENKC